jgi:two-component system, LytTR family, sensor histidine kinase AlgZ
LLALRANLDPHFLFNTLNAIAEWCHQDSATAEAALLKLSAMLRTVFDGVREPTWPLERELELVRTLFDMHRLRDPARFELAWDAPSPAPAVQVPPLLLLPLAENAMKHGPGAGAGHRGEVRLSVSAAPGGGVAVELSNPGPFRGPRAGGSGLPTLQRRLAMAYGDAAVLEVKDDGGRTRVRLQLPPAPEAKVAT